MAGSKNWENRNIFGGIDTVTDKDYKNSAYFSLKVRFICLEFIWIYLHLTHFFTTTVTKEMLIDFW